ncbi:MAG: 2-hydroxy-3-oxopropionate reductase [Verrucomicrobia bacterium]|nr:2-hydroxy-3-oxopropionate reductase [Verrucomicrobiota bacterium]
MKKNHHETINIIGFIGLGIMGKPMAKNLCRAGRQLVVHDRNSGPVEELLAMGARAAGSPREVAAQSDVVITMLPNSPDVSAVLLGKDGVLAGAKPGLIVVDMSSIAPLVARELCQTAAQRGVAMLDAPVSGGEPKAMDGTLAVMAGGSEEAFETVKDILSIMGRSVVRVGESGSGQVAKLANQMIVGLNIAAMSEAMVLAKKVGVDPENVFEAIRGGLAGSAVLDAKMPLVLDGRFKPGFRLELHIKDLMNALDTAHAVGAPALLTAQVCGYMQMLKAEGKGGHDHGALIQFFEKLAGIEVRKTRESCG